MCILFGFGSFHILLQPLCYVVTQYHIPAFIVFRLADMDLPAIKINIGDFELTHFTYTQPI